MRINWSTPAAATFAGRATLLLIVLYGEKHWDLRVPTIMVAAMGVVSPGLLSSGAYWLAQALILFIGTFSRLYTVDNHKVLLCYWVLALALAGSSQVRLATNARLLVGACFLFAAIWKAVTPGYVDGSFMHHTILTDSRFSTFASLVCGLTASAAAQNKSALVDFEKGAVTECTLQSTPLLDTVALCSTYLILAIEGMIGVAFLTFRKLQILDRSRNVILVGFMVATYPVATVMGFAWLLCIMGYCQCRAEEGRARTAYAALFVLLQLVTIPWGRVLVIT